MMYKGVWVLLLWLCVPLGFAHHLAEPSLSLVSVALGETVQVHMPVGGTITKATLDYPTTLIKLVGNKKTMVPVKFATLDVGVDSFTIPLAVDQLGRRVSVTTFDETAIGRDYNFIRGGIHKLSLEYTIGGQRQSPIETLINIISRSTGRTNPPQPRYTTILVWYSPKITPNNRLRAFLEGVIKAKGIDIKIAPSIIPIYPLGGGSDLCNGAIAQVQVIGPGIKDFGRTLDQLRDALAVPRDTTIRSSTDKNTYAGKNNDFMQWDIVQSGGVDFSKPIWRIDPLIPQNVLYHGGYHVGPDEDWDVKNPPTDFVKIRNTGPGVLPCFANAGGQACDLVQVAVLDTAGRYWNGQRVPTEVVVRSDATDPFDPIVRDANGQEHHFSIGHGIPIGSLVATLVEPGGLLPSGDGRIIPTYIAVCDKDGICLDREVVQGICAALRELKNNNNVADTGNGYRGLVLNLSFGAYDPSPVLWEILNEATGNGVLVAAAAGNWGREAPEVTLFPAAYDLPGIVAVGSLYKIPDGTGWKRSLTSMKGEIYAPGRGVEARSASPSEIWYSYNGTSFATPFVATALARYRNKYPKNTTMSAEAFVRCLFTHGAVNENVEDIGNNTIGRLTNTVPDSCP